MVGDNILRVATEDGHSVQTMLTTYAAWTEGATAADVEQIREAREHSPTPTYPLCRDSIGEGVPGIPLQAPDFASRAA
jgi:hypothetical protein